MSKIENSSLHGDSFPIGWLHHVIHAVCRRLQNAAYVMKHWVKK